METPNTEIDALKIAVKAILQQQNMASVKTSLIATANSKIIRGESIGESGNHERGVGTQLRILTNP